MCHLKRTNFAPNLRSCRALSAARRGKVRRGEAAARRQLSSACCSASFAFLLPRQLQQARKQQSCVIDFPISDIKLLFNVFCIANLQAKNDFLNTFNINYSLATKSDIILSILYFIILTSSRLYFDLYRWRGQL